jgi:pyruvate dehydrogenase (quinone)
MALGRRAPTAFGAVGSARPTLKLLLGQVAPKSDTSFWERVTKERREWDAMLDKQANPARSKDCIHPPAVARAVTAISGALAIDGPVTPWFCKRAAEQPASPVGSRRAVRSGKD